VAAITAVNVGFSACLGLPGRRGAGGVPGIGLSMN
jgi:hypothetical protein